MDVRLEQDRAVLCLHGELDLASAELFHSEFESAEIGGAQMVVLDLEGLQFVDSTGLRMILSAHERARERGQEFAITPGSPQVLAQRTARLAANGPASARHRVWPGAPAPEGPRAAAEPAAEANTLKPCSQTSAWP